MAIRVLLSIGECAQGSNPHSCFVCTYVADMENPLDGGLSCYKTTSLFDDHSG
jgi:hypothetical protein